MNTEFKDKTIVCQDCKEEFVFSAGEQEFFASRGLEQEPKRCKSCRDARKNNFNNRRNNEKSGN